MIICSSTSFTSISNNELDRFEMFPAVGNNNRETLLKTDQRNKSYNNLETKPLFDRTKSLRENLQSRLSD